MRKFTFLVTIVNLIAMSTIAQEKGSFKDSRDGKTYKIVNIGKQIWLAENLNFETVSGSWCYANNTNYCKKYGRLYDWQTAQTVCPNGWHLPVNDEWTQLTDNLGGESTAGGKMKALINWNNPNTGADNSSGFAAQPGGIRANGEFMGLWSGGGFWSATEDGTTLAWGRMFDFKSAGIAGNNCKKAFAISVRCLKDNSSKNSSGEIQKTVNNGITQKVENTFIDSRDGKTYKTVEIKNQTWMAENLNYIISSGSWCYGDKPDNCNVYGRLYSWDAAMKACPKGWHLPIDAEWLLLTENLGGKSMAGERMKEAGTTHWTSPNKDAGNSSGFTAIPGGSRGNDGSFSKIGDNGGWWTATEINATLAWGLGLTSVGSSIIRFGDFKDVGFSVRCIKGN